MGASRQDTILLGFGFGSEYRLVSGVLERTDWCCTFLFCFEKRGTVLLDPRVESLRRIMEIIQSTHPLPSHHASASLPW